MRVRIPLLLPRVARSTAEHLALNQAPQGSTPWRPTGTTASQLSDNRISHSMRAQRLCVVRAFHSRDVRRSDAELLTQNEWVRFLPLEPACGTTSNGSHLSSGAPLDATSPIGHRLWSQTDSKPVGQRSTRWWPANARYARLVRAPG